ncbi:MAG: DUF4330 domain-containing protein [Clostridia bacterium]|nr:DUF4330 domain-containing protein [Clostridia bacterium]
MQYIKPKKRGHDDGDARSVRINIVDIALIIVLVFLVLVAIEYFTSFSFFGNAGSSQTIEYTVEFDGVSSAMANSIAVGDTALGSVGTQSLGTVSSVKIEPQVKYIYDPASGGIVQRALPADAAGNTPVKLCVTLQVKATYKAGAGYTVNGNRISVGSPVNLSFDGFSGGGSCVSIYGVY